MVCFQFHLKPHFKIIIAASIASTVSACGGGGGGGGGSVGGAISRLPITITNPDPGVVIEPSALELANTPSLGDVAAASVYHLGVSGEGITIGVVDSGVDKTHDELSGRVIGGGDWQSSGDGTSDPYGHGTHVASIIAASSNNKGMQGIAPLAEIVSYRILNSAGKFGGKSGNTMLPAILGNVKARNLKVVNNSWASIYEITDLSASTIESAISSELSAYRKSATASGPVMVRAAGNGSDNNVSVRSGLPYYFPELKANWLTGLADIKGLSGLARIQESTQKKIPVAIMGASTSQSEMRMVLEAGAVGYIPKNIGIKAFYSAITLMAEGEIFLPADHGTHRSENSFLPNNWLTGREQDMLAGLLAGKSNKEIARKHGLSEVTVKHHLKSLRGKLGAKNRTHAVCRAIELGIVPE